MNVLRRYFSPDAVRQALQAILARFPFTVAYLSLLCAWLIVMVLNSFELKPMIIESVTWPLCEGVLLSIAASVWCEYLRQDSKAGLVQLVILGFVFVDCLALLFRGGVSDVSENIGRSAVVTALFIAILFLPSAPGLDRKQLWYYSLRQFGAMAAGVALAVVLVIAVVVIFGTLGTLFNFNSWKVMYVFNILLGVYVPVLFYLSRAPEREELVEARAADDLSTIGAFCKNVLLPLVGVYTLILYIYAAKILFTWSLPTDSISVMVTGLMCVSLIMLYGLQRYSFDDEANERAKRISSFARTILPLALLPLLVLMSIGVGYRVGEYGLTASRLYVIVFNVWAYGVVLYLIFKKSANLNIIAGTFAVVFVLVSIIPGMNLTAIATRSVRSEVIRTLTDAGAEVFPISEEKLKEIIKTLPRSEAENLASRLQYLDDWNDHSRVQDIVASDVELRAWRLLPDEFDSDAVTPDVERNSRECTAEIEVPEGFSAVKYCKYYYLNQKVNADSVFSADPESMEPLTVCVDDRTVFVITQIFRSGTWDERKYKFSGYEFKK